MDQSDKGDRSPCPPAPSQEVDLHVLYLREAPRLLRYFRRRADARDDTADLVQESFARFAGGLPRATIANPAAYLHRIARNLLFDRTRAKRLRPLLVDDPEAVEAVAIAATQSDGMEADELMTAYRRAVEQLPPRTREVFLLNRADGLSYKAIADRLGIGVRTVEWHIAEALVRIRQALDDND